ncbi:hypothetical protein STIAU_1585, partial [Stigmatella aurantiaca DW4/3-1]
GSTGSARAPPRCRDILVQMAADAGASHGEAFVPLSPAPGR